MHTPAIRARPEVSIIVATFQRCAHLRCCIEWVQRTTAASYEMIIVDGGSNDGTSEFAAAQPHARLIRETQRAGCCRAYDIGLRAAHGEFVMWLNDDSYPLEGAIDTALRFMRHPNARNVGMAAFYHTHRDPWNELHGYDDEGMRFGVLHVRGTPYANFGLLPRTLLEQVDFLDTGYRFCAWDPDLSLKIQRQTGRKVVGLPDARVWHEEHIDERKEMDARCQRRLDNERMFAKWNLPAKGAFAPPQSAYRMLASACGIKLNHERW
ncbi:MAG: glycosyltransferase [Phycisphaerales bacterium]|nr:glycosyltransferase [Phycisphaerales bacterium]